VNIEGHGIAATLPARWEGVIGQRPEAAAAGTALVTGTGETTASSGGLGSPDERILPTAHLATIALPAERGDFGSGAVDNLGPDDLFVALLEYGPECAGTAAFSRQGVPRRARRTNFGRRSLQRTIDGQAGWQQFCTENGRAFCLYVVLGRDSEIEPLLTELDTVLGSFRITPA
jgi:hypothetical protein